jgi:Protein of unknown function (DUF1552)
MKKSRVQQLGRRQFLRGAISGMGVIVGLPILDCMLNENGTAFGAELGGGALPPLFGTWFWPLGLSPGQWEPKTTGAVFEFGRELQGLNPIRNKMNLISGLQVYADGKVQLPHYTTADAVMTGQVRAQNESHVISIDEVVADRLGVRTRFPSLTVACDGLTSTSFSARGANTMNPAEISPAALYRRIFGESFIDPNAAEFKPDPAVLSRRSVLSAVQEERKALITQVGARDRERLDSFFTSVRDLENKLDIELQRPAPLAACQRPQPPGPEETGLLIGEVLGTHNLFVRLLSHALACGQTRIFNVALAKGAAQIRKPGDSTGFHNYTHEERIDPKLGYQPTCSWFSSQLMTAFRELVTTLDSYKEGNGTLLDRSLIYACTDHGEARLHSLKNLMMFTAGGANHRIRTGMHIAAPGEPFTRVALTCQRALGIEASTWGSGSNTTTKPFEELLI